jgi:hypothetical protein
MSYSLQLTFNNRREIYTELNVQGNKTNSIVVALDSTSKTNILSISKTHVLKYLQESGVDISISDVDFTATLANTELTIKLKQKVKAEAPTQQASSTNSNAYYHELDEEEILQQQKQQEKNQTLQASSLNESKTLGNIGSHIKCTSIENSSTYNIDVTATEIENLKTFDEFCVTVHIVFEHNNNSYSCSVPIFLAHPAQYMALALDFGSESSQLAVQHYDTQFGIRAKQPSVENLFENVKNYYINKKWSEDDDAQYYQEEADSNFYKSVFFLKERLSNSYNSLEEEIYIKDQAQNLKMLVKVGALAELLESKHYQLPNLKISHKHADLLKRYKIKIDLQGAQYTSTLNDMQSLVSSNILRTIIASMLHKDMLRYKQHTRMIRLMLLVPNIYDVEHVAKVQRQLNTILQELAAEEFKDRLLAWEVLTTSESDAAFIGYLNKEQTVVQKNKDYVVVDMGKGTTDFSILRTGQHSLTNLESIYRNGFAGAGNLITHAIFETILHFIREQNYETSGVQNYLRDTVLAVLDGNNLGARNQFFNEIERLKFDFSNNTEAQRTQWLRAKVGDYQWHNIVEKRTDVATDFNTITNLLKQLEHGADFYGYVQDVCEAISTKVVSHLAMVKNNKKDFDCDGVILTGRGFLFKPLQQLVIQKLNSELNIAAHKVSVLNGNELKDICIKGVFDNSVRVHSESVGHPIQIIRSGGTVAAVQITTTEASTSNWFQRLLTNAIHNDAKNYKHQFVQNNQLSFAELSNSHIVVGSNTYKVSHSRIFEVQANMQYKATIDYTSYGYIVRRHCNGAVDCISRLEQVIDYSNIDKQMVIPSLFPNYIMEENIQSMKAAITPLPKATVNAPIVETATPTLPSNPTPETPFNDLLF